MLSQEWLLQIYLHNEKMEIAGKIAWRGASSKGAKGDRFFLRYLNLSYQKFQVFNV